MSSKSDSRKQRNLDDNDRHSRSHKPRSRSRSPKTSHRKKDKPHRSERSGDDVHRRPEREDDVRRKPEREDNVRRKPEREDNVRMKPERDDNVRMKPERDENVRRKPEREDNVRRKPEREDNVRRKPEREDVPLPGKVKSEPADKGYKKYEFPGKKERERESRSRWDEDDKKQEQGRTHGGDRRGNRQEQPQIKIKQEREHNDDRRREHRAQIGDENPFQTNDEDEGEENAPAAPKEEPDFGLSGALAEDTNTFRGVVIKYNEPPEARKPKLRWRLYVFKGDQEMPTLYIHRQSAYLLGRERLIADLPIDHPSCSKQHAAIQYRLVEYAKSDGTTGKRVRPYIIDLESANGTFLNNKQIEAKRYYEMQEKDVLKFGFSSREYVVLHDKTTAGDLEDEGEV